MLLQHRTLELLSDQGSGAAGHSVDGGHGRVPGTLDRDGSGEHRAQVGPAFV
jgi:hypothetical protein